MADRESLKTHAGLVDRMASALGVDLVESALDRKIRTSEIADTVLRCTQCPNPDHCRAFLARTQQADSSPEYCRNRELFETLRG